VHGSRWRREETKPVAQYAPHGRGASRRSYMKQLRARWGPLTRPSERGFCGVAEAWRTDSGESPLNALHLILTIVTVGLWGIVWIIVALGGGERRTQIAVDE
jgi:hypothetical protein